MSTARARDFFVGTLLVVAPEPDVALILARRLRDREVLVLHATTVRRALQLMEECSFEVIVWNDSALLEEPRAFSEAITRRQPSAIQVPVGDVHPFEVRSVERAVAHALEHPGPRATDLPADVVAALGVRNVTIADVDATPAANG